MTHISTVIKFVRLLVWK